MDFSKIDETTGGLFQVQTENDEDSIRISFHPTLEDDPSVVTLDKGRLIDSPLPAAARQRVEALWTARAVLSEEGARNVFTSNGGAKLAGDIPTALINVAEYIVTGIPLVTERTRNLNG